MDGSMKVILIPEAQAYAAYGRLEQRLADLWGLIEPTGDKALINAFAWLHHEAKALAYRYEITPPVTGPATAAPTSKPPSPQ